MNAAARRAARAGHPDPAPEPARGTMGVGGIVSSGLGMARRTLGSPTGLAGLALEAGWIGVHLGLYPLGLRGSRASDQHRGYQISHLPPTQRSFVAHDLDAAQTPILLIHGLVDNRSIFTVLRRGLARRGFGRIDTMNYSVFTGDVRTAAAQLAHEVDRIVEETGYERIHIVGHSMGGLIARYYVTRLGGDAHVHTLVTLGTPHHGTYLAMGLNTNLTRQLRPGSALYAELDRPVRRCRTRFLVFWSDTDQVVFPQVNAALEHPSLNVTNVQLSGVGHMSLPVVPSVVGQVSAALAHLDAGGQTVASGVSALGARRLART